MAEPAKDWRQDLAFSDRLAATTAISSAYSAANPGSSSVSAKRYAKAEEISARQHALTLEEYHDLCGKAIQLLQASATTSGPAHTQQAGEDVFHNLPEADATIGTFTHARHHRDGIFSEVFVAKDPESGRVVALKITTPSMMTPPHDSMREARILSSLGSSSNTISLLQTFKQPQGRFILVFPFMRYDLSTLLVQNTLPHSGRKTVLRDLFSALAHIHAQDMIHRDVKPSNILLESPEGPAYLADFGIAWSAQDSDSEAANSKILEVGTTCYRPPELLFGYQEYGTALDMWAAGCVAAQVLSLGRETLFDAGELGSELALIKSIFDTLGTPDLEVWPEAVKLPDWGKMNFMRYPRRPWTEILPRCEQTARSLIADLVVFESSARRTASMALQHPYFGQ